MPLSKSHTLSLAILFHKHHRMKVIHGTWIPDPAADFIQEGCFYLWIETDQKRRIKNGHPYQLNEAELMDVLVNELGIGGGSAVSEYLQLTPKYFLLPSAQNVPLHSPELSRYLEEDRPPEFDWQWWQIDCLKLDIYQQSYRFNRNLAYGLQVFQDLHFLASIQLQEIQLGADILFWYHFCQGLKSIIARDQFIPSLTYRQKSIGSGKKQTTKYELYPEWEILSDDYETLLERSLSVMPLVCCAGFGEPQAMDGLHDPETLLRHCSEVILNQLITKTDFPNVFTKRISDTLLESCINLKSSLSGLHPEKIPPFTAWWQWRDRIAHSQLNQQFQLYFVLEAPNRAEDPWALMFHVAPVSDPSLRLALHDYWQFPKSQRTKTLKSLGQNFEQQLLKGLGYASRICPELWPGLETASPEGVYLSLDQAAQFLEESAWVLEDAGFKVIVPAWWTPQGQRRAKLRLRPQSKKASASSSGKGYFALEDLVDYQYELAMGDEPVSLQEWESLVNAKTSLVRFRGEWLQLDPSKMKEMLEFWKANQGGEAKLSLLDLMQIAADPSSNIELDASRDRFMDELLGTLQNKSQLKPVGPLPDFKGTLREYQDRGVAWLSYLESVGLNGCLADDMGLGKTVQVIARLVLERTPSQPRKKAKPTQVPPTLLIAPTSVLGNWVKELERFAPQLRAIVHHGSDRPQSVQDFVKICQSLDVVITSFSLIRKDLKLFEAMDWQRIVIDEAQNIKNPKAAQTKAILKLKAPHRLALTGTPVENRLLDLWSIFNFLNPGYLGKEAQFRRNFERPIQRNNDPIRAQHLKTLVEPFILRRVKTDPDIISDLPDKVEQKLFCNLTKEQASLYEAVTKTVIKELQNSEGIQRQGIMLSTLMKLKQICNHPMQFLQDNSDFSPERSHKLSRLQEMTAEVIEEGESLLIFTQFTEIGDALQHRLRQQFYNTYYIHGGTSRTKRETMIREFQDPETPPSVFILSLKAGGVGITLTKANHVFHFDRWWNPAVEDQATDRAFRIGQTKNVFVHKFVAIGTLEERIDQMIEDKKKLAGAVVGNDESWLTQLDNETFKQLIALNKNAILE
ncbi:DEAD/DEAH box helicase [Lyngbya confervoides]|uniref:DEAD/DEAH box helicase n=1 Tax=Lyngbya confervoides BDU141951 TaxID=1574623 RepID=A0ABD4T1B0_9CYAN|nr:DEAD/DEAH box helicase [Lyngbya confervoides]MCM1982413.1 DEAD/DEAH box helicase [Lyngbya confervoides BDU141951]